MVRATCLAAALVAMPIVTEAQQPCTRDAQAVVSEVYQRILERPVDQSASGWVSMLQHGSTVREIVAYVAKSPEYAQKFLSGDPKDGVTNLYRHLLGRTPDIGGLADNSEAAAKGWGPVIDSMIRSREYDRFAGNNGVPGTSVRYCGGITSPFRTNQTSESKFPGMDRNNDGMITRGEWTGSRAVFTQNDWNQDGVLSGDEIRVESNPRPSGRLFADEDDRFDSLDINGNGRVERSEWRASADAFTWLDRDDNGVLSRAEVVSPEAFNALDQDGDARLSAREWPWSRASFSQQDTNGDGLLTRQEFLRAPGLGR